MCRSRSQGLTGVTALTAEDFDVCALLVDGTVRCWGYNFFGELGNGGTTRFVDAGRGHRPLRRHLDRDEDRRRARLRAAGGPGRCECWGYNGYGQLGYGVRSEPISCLRARHRPLRCHAIAVGAYHSCALLADGTVVCWGSDVYGSSATGTPTPPAGHRDHVAGMPASLRVRWSTDGYV